MRKFLLVLVLSMLTLTGHAATVYISDALTVPLRRGPSSNHKILHAGLPSGMALEVISEDRAAGFTQVRTPNGTEGWVPTQYLTEQPIAKDRLAVGNRRIQTLEAELKKLREGVQQARGTSNEAQRENAALTKQAEQLQAELAEIRRVSATSIAHYEENKQLKALNQELQTQTTQLTERVRQLERNVMLRWLLAGGGLVLLGGLGVLVVGVHASEPLLVVFGLVGLAVAVDAVRAPARARAHPAWWVREHYSAMIGNGVASHIAFLGIGLRGMWPGLDAQWLQWLASVQLQAAGEAAHRHGMRFEVVTPFEELRVGYEGKVVLLDFWTTWCPPCREQMPIVERLHADETLRESLGVGSVNLDEPSPDRVAKVQAYLTRAGYQTPTLIGSPRDASAYQVTSYPTLILIDPQGQVARVMTGLRSEQTLREAIAQLNATPAKPQ